MQLSSLNKVMRFDYIIFNADYAKSLRPLTCDKYYLKRKKKLLFPRLDFQAYCDQTSTSSILTFKTIIFIIDFKLNVNLFVY